MPLKLVFKTSKDTNETLLIAQSTNDATIAHVVENANDNTSFGKNKHGDIRGNKSIIEVVDKEIVVSAFNSFGSIGGTTESI